MLWCDRSSGTSSIGSHQKRYYSYSDSTGECLECPSFSTVVRRTGIILLHDATYYSHPAVGTFCMEKIERSQRAEGGVQTKLIVLISFYQVTTTFQDVYGMAETGRGLYRDI